MKFAKTVLIFSVLMISALPASAQSIIDEPFCFMRMGGELLDLTDMCGSLPPLFNSTPNTIGNAIEVRSSSSGITAGGGRATGGSFVDAAIGGSALQNSSSPSSSRSSGGNCQFASQLDSAGRRCGDRAASQRPGGR